MHLPETDDGAARVLPLGSDQAEFSVRVPQAEEPRAGREIRSGSGRRRSCSLNPQGMSNRVSGRGPDKSKSARACVARAARRAGRQTLGLFLRRDLFLLHTAGRRDGRVGITRERAERGGQSDHDAERAPEPPDAGRVNRSLMVVALVPGERAVKQSREGVHEGLETGTGKVRVINPGCRPFSIALDLERVSQAVPAARSRRRRCRGFHGIEE